MSRSLSSEISAISRYAYRRTPRNDATGMTRKRRPSPSAGNGSRMRHDASSPSPRLPSGRLRPSATGYGEGRGEGAFPPAQGRGEAPSPDPHPSLPRLRGREGVGADLSPLAGRGEDRGRPRLSPPPGDGDTNRIAKVIA